MKVSWLILVCHSNCVYIALIHFIPYEKWWIWEFSQEILPHEKFIVYPFRACGKTLSLSLSHTHSNYVTDYTIEKRINAIHYITTIFSVILWIVYFREFSLRRSVLFWYFHHLSCETGTHDSYSHVSTTLSLLCH